MVETEGAALGAVQITCQAPFLIAEAKTLVIARFEAALVESAAMASVPVVVTS